MIQIHTKPICKEYKHERNTYKDNRNDRDRKNCYENRN